MLIDLKKIMDRGYDLKEPQQWPVYGTGKNLDRTAVVTASEIGYCARKIKFDKHAMLEGGYDPSVGTKNTSDIEWGFFERGHNIEAWAVSMLHRGWHGTEYTLLHTGEHQLSFVSDFQSGTPDGLIVSIMDEKVGILEIKSFDPRTNVNRKLPKAAHKDQVIQNLDLVSIEMDKTPIGGELLYIDASDHKRRFQFHVPWDEERAAYLEKRAKWIISASGPASLPPEGLFKDDCRYCNFTSQCSAMVTKERMEKGSVNCFEDTAKKFFG